MIAIAPNKSNRRNIMLVEDHPIFRHGLAQVIAHDEKLRVCAEVESVAQAMEAIEQMKPDLVLLDLSLKGSSGMELLKVIRSHYPGVPVLVLSMHDEALYAERALRAGASGYLMKQQPPETVREAIHAVLAGEIFLSEQTKTKIVNKALHGGNREGHSPVESLSDRELEVLMFTGRGFSTKRIAEELSLSTKTIESHRASIKQKLQLTDMTALVRFAVEWVSEQGA